MKQRIYISGPITGHDDYKERFADAADMVRKNGYRAVNPTAMFGWFQPLFAVMPYRLQVFIDCLVLCTCKGIFLMPGYETSRGARLEKAVAEFMGVPIYKQFKEPEGELPWVLQLFSEMGKQIAKFGM